MNWVNHPLWWQIEGMISWRIWWITNFGDNFSDGPTFSDLSISDLVNDSFIDSVTDYQWLAFDYWGFTAQSPWEENFTEESEKYNWNLDTNPIFRYSEEHSQNLRRMPMNPKEIAKKYEQSNMQILVVKPEIRNNNKTNGSSWRFTCRVPVNLQVTR